MENLLRRRPLQRQLGVHGALIFHLDIGAGLARQPGEILVDVRSVDADEKGSGLDPINNHIVDDAARSLSKKLYCA